MVIINSLKSEKKASAVINHGKKGNSVWNDKMVETWI